MDDLRQCKQRKKKYTPIRTKIWESTRCTTIVELRTGKRRWVVLQKARNVTLLVARDAKDIAEASTGENNLLACTLGVVDGISWVDLGSANGCDEGAA